MSLQSSPPVPYNPTAGALREVASAPQQAPQPIPLKQEASTAAPAAPVASMSQQHVAFSTIRNPANPGRVFIYRVAPDDNTLSFEQRAIHKGVSAPRWNKNPTTSGVPSTPLRGDSNIVTMVFDDVVHIYGVCATSNRLALLSPFVEPIEPVAKASSGKIAGCAFTEHDEEQAWLVYQGYESTDDDALPKLKYCDITTPETPDTDSTAKDILESTSLSLFHDTRRFWVVYQNTDGQLVAHNEKDQKPSVISADMSHFTAKTPIASCFIPAKYIDANRVPGFRSGALGRVIVYWVRMFNNKPCLYRSHADLTEKSSSADFSEPRQATENGVTVEPLAQINVVINPATQSNYVFVAKHGGDNISSVTDVWSTKDESMYGLDMNNAELFKRWQAKIMEEALLGAPRYGNGHLGFGDDKPHHHHHHPRLNGNGYSEGYTNGTRLIGEDFLDKMSGSKTMVEEILEDEFINRNGNGNRNMPLVWRNKGDTTKPQLHSGVITRTASSRWSEAEVQVVVPAGSTIMGDIMIQLKVRPTD